MPTLAVYACCLNALLWLCHSTLFAPLASAPTLIRWGLVLLAPCALFAAALRALPCGRAPLALVTATSIGALGLLG
jgi:hypothetical protein